MPGVEVLDDDDGRGESGWQRSQDMAQRFQAPGRSRQCDDAKDAFGGLLPDMRSVLWGKLFFSPALPFSSPALGKEPYC